jgi:hypothetical protein
VGKTPIYVATSGSDINTGLDINNPKLHVRSAIQYANQHPSTPYVIYLRGGTHYESASFDYLEIERGDLFITAYPGEEVVLRPHFWPSNPTDWGQSHLFVSVGPYQSIAISNLTLQGWDEPFFFGSQYEEGPMRNLVIKNITANEFRRRFPNWGPVFFETNYVTRDFFSGPDAFDPNAPGIKYQIEGLILSGIFLEDAGLAVNIGDEKDANVKGLRISRLELRNSPTGGNNTAIDGMAVVNSSKVLIDTSVVQNTEGDGIDCKSVDVCIVNSYVHATTRNGVKLWRNGELINSIVHGCSPVADAAIVVEGDRPFRMIHSVLMGETPGYAGTYNYSGTSTAKFEIVNSIFSDLSHTFYIGTSNLQSRNSLYHDTSGGIFSGQRTAANVAELNAIPGCSGNIAGDPLFTDPANEDFRLQESSPCRDAGTGADVLLPSFDYYGYARLMGAGYDIGPCEYLGSAPGGDEDGDGLLNAEEDLDMDGELDAGETDANNADTDSDGFSDPIEVFCGSNPRAPGSTPHTVWINFQPPGSARPSGYCPDSGRSFGQMGYGWN